MVHFNDLVHMVYTNALVVVNNKNTTTKASMITTAMTTTETIYGCMHECVFGQIFICFSAKSAKIKQMSFSQSASQQVSF